MKATRGVAALALLMLMGCDDDSCPGVGGPDGYGIITVIIGSRITGDCATPLNEEFEPALITGDLDTCFHRVPSYSDGSRCEYSIEVVCQDSLGAWGFVLDDAVYVGDGRYEGILGFSRATSDGTPTCSASYPVVYINR